MPAISVPTCDKFTANPGDIIQWTNVPPSGCTVSQAGPGAWPFTAPSPIILPVPGGVGVKPGLPPGTYCFIVSCCEKTRVCMTIT
jgi:hypothetical protein